MTSKIDHEEAGHYFNDLDWPGAVQDIQAAANYLHKNGVEKVGVVGFCMGGALSLASAVLVRTNIYFFYNQNKSLTI